MPNRRGEHRTFGSSAEFGEAAHGLAAHLLGSLTRPHLDPWSEAVLAVAVFDSPVGAAAALPRLYLRHRARTFGHPWTRIEWSEHVDGSELTRFVHRLGARRGPHLLWVHLRRWRTPEDSGTLTDIAVRFTSAHWLVPEMLDDPSMVAAVATDRTGEERAGDRVVFTYTFAPPWPPPTRADG